MPITVQCGACTKRFRAGDQHAGKRGKCPSCGAVIHVPEPTPPPPSANTLASLLDEEMISSTSPSKCPSCAHALPAGAALCVNCGHDLRTGKKLTVERDVDESAAPPERGKRGKKKTGSLAGRAVKFGGSFALGILLSAVGAAIGAGIWYGVALGTGRESGWIAVGLGFLAGAGMVLGHREENDLSGITAGGVSILGILLAKWLIFERVIKPLAAEFGVAGEISYADMFGPMDGIFVLLAAATAYKIGNASPTD